MNFNGNSLIKYYSASNSKHFNLNFSLRNKNFSSFSSISFKNFDDLKTGNKRTEKHPDFGKRLEFVEVGNKIKKGDTIMIVEAMKTMNHIPSTFDGTVKEICVEDGQPVEFGQKITILD